MSPRSDAQMSKRLWAADGSRSTKRVNLTASVLRDKTDVHAQNANPHMGPQIRCDKKLSHEKVPLPNILVYIDGDQSGCPTEPSLFAVREARRVCRAAGASLYALLAHAPLSQRQLDAFSVPIGRAGADKLLLCESPEFARPAEDGIHGRALSAALRKIPSTLVLFPAGGSARALGPPLAARLNGPYVAAADLVVSDSDAESLAGRGRVHVVHWLPGLAQQAQLDPIEIERPLVVALRSGRWGNENDHGARDLEIEIIPARELSPSPKSDELEREVDPWSAFERASVVVLLGDTLSPSIDSDGHSDVWQRAVDEAQLGACVATARANALPPALCRHLCPDVIVRVGANSHWPELSRAPATRVLHLLPAQASPAADVDIIWQPPSSEDLSPKDLVEVLRSLGAPSR